MSNINEKKKFHFIYKTTNLINSKYYIGMHSTSNLKDGYLGSGKYLRSSIKKYGIENFKIEILEYYESRELLASREKEIVNEAFLKDVLCMNLKCGGSGGFAYADSERGRINANIKRKFLFETDEEFKLNFSNSVKIGLQKARKSGKDFGFQATNQRYDWSGKKHNPTSILKMILSASDKQKSVGKLNSQYGTIWITDGSLNMKINNQEIIPPGWKRGRVVVRKLNVT